ncbi:CLUMA_CG021632, isoform A [Clunio marinus]|uniref:CLUMA_CG021632, isoform A n=1 Tax=Clunio marinus TaxID=568069 RepID=A0A1J1J7U5_9DIPT|nr:CLUMA_CG021632, isoform A [Clunio marinus]
MPHVIPVSEQPAAFFTHSNPTSSHSFPNSGRLLETHRMKIIADVNHIHRKPIYECFIRTLHLMMTMPNRRNFFP